MPKGRVLPIASDVIVVHKRAQRSRGRGPLSVCRRYGFTTHLWRNVTCDACLNTPAGSKWRNRMAA